VPRVNRSIALAPLKSDVEVGLITQLCCREFLYQKGKLILKMNTLKNTLQMCTYQKYNTI